MDPVDAADAVVAKPVQVLVPLAVAITDDLPGICALTGIATAGRWIRRFGRRVRVSIPVSEQLLVQYAKRSRGARVCLFGLALAWVLAALVAIPAASAPGSSPLGPIAGLLFLLGLLLFLPGVVLLVKATATIPLRMRVVVDQRGVPYLRIGNASPTFAQALAGLQTPTAAGTRRGAALQPVGRTHVPVRWRILIPYATAVVAFVAVYAHTLTSQDIPAVIVLAAVLAAIGFVAMSLKWRIHIGSMFTLTPVNAVTIVLVAALTSAVGLIVAIDPEHESAGAEAIGGCSGAAVGVVAVVLIESFWHRIRAAMSRLSTPTRNPSD